jgi:thiosulfate reductase cytochrome b subunit
MTTFRRGLPRVAGGDAWPPATATAAFTVRLPRTTAPAVSAERAAPEVQASAPSVIGASAPRATAETSTRRRGLAKAAAISVGAAAAAAVVVIAARLFLFGTPWGAEFVKAYPGTTPLPSWAPAGQPLWLQWQHWLNAFFLILIIRTGWTVRRTSRPAAMWQRRAGGRKISIELFSHLCVDALWVANGVVFWILLFVTGQYIRIVPYTWEVLPNAASAALQYASLSWPTEDGWTNYNSLQVLAYFVTVFIAAPLALLTGLRLSPLWPGSAKRLSRIYPIEVARRLHFPVMLYFVAFVIVHVVLVLATGALRNLNHMFWGSDDPASWIGFLMFLLGLIVMIGGWFAVAPRVMTYLGAGVGKVGR